ncbi:late competence development ComFB family protein [Clostridium sp. WLY-B-L2]|uniref:Late competence development ComFB family protein n=2 Tax=Clostridiaceae TaxID=31979 RepID=A0ABS8N2A6_9CLOT|nr:MULTISPECIES: late competence development ComFB family protein [Clostridium]KAA8675388.1 competence protein ComFB [Clostridium sp. HV4-5-A1G]MCC9293936.1 late competence development ComFB family protein [Clostridium aromativorans]
MVKNYMEDVVDKLLPEVLKNYDNICKCPKCIDDIKAIVLNNLKPRYISTEKGLLYTKINELSREFNTNVIKEIALAINIVSENPHDC